jgi:hypothetical protein
VGARHWTVTFFDARTYTEAMVMGSARLAVPAIAAVLLVMELGAVVHAADQASPLPGQEWAAIEVSPLSFNLGSAEQSPTRVQPGPGGTLRLLRHRWKRAYVTPIQAGLFIGELGGATILAHVDVEGGFILPLNADTQAFELGLAAGAGILAVPYATTCDGSCNIGGAGPLLSPVVRYVAWGFSRFTAGFTLRAVIPLVVPTGDWYGYYTGRAILFLAAVDLAFGS